MKFVPSIQSRERTKEQVRHDYEFWHTTFSGTAFRVPLKNVAINNLNCGGSETGVPRARREPCTRHKTGGGAGPLLGEPFRLWARKEWHPECK